MTILNNELIEKIISTLIISDCHIDNNFEDTFGKALLVTFTRNNYIANALEWIDDYGNFSSDSNLDLNCGNYFDELFTAEERAVLYDNDSDPLKIICDTMRCELNRIQSLKK